MNNLEENKQIDVVSDIETCGKVNLYMLASVWERSVLGLTPKDDADFEIMRAKNMIHGLMTLSTIRTDQAAWRELAFLRELLSNRYYG